MKVLLLFETISYLVVVKMTDRLSIRISAEEISTHTHGRFVSLENKMIPTSGMTAVVDSISHDSVVGCAAECNRFANHCSSFIFQPTSVACQREVSEVGTCRLLAFSNLYDVVLGHGTSCQRFYVRDLCSRADTDPCMNSGECRMSLWPYICKCKTGFGGLFCEIGTYRRFP